MPALPITAPFDGTSWSPPWALSLRAPWDWAILHAGKRVENRTWYTAYRGPLLIHASKFGGTMAQQEEVAEDVDFMLDMWRKAGGPPEPEKLTLRMLLENRGGVVGVCQLVDVICPGGMAGRGRGAPRHQKADDPWYVGDYGFVLEEPRKLPFVACLGATGLFVPSGECWPALEKAMEGAT
jgi:hypothetical protein